jgi:uncharacterized protein DUF3224
MVKGTFEVRMSPEPPFDGAEGVPLGRVGLDKTFSGPLEATSQGFMLAARTKIEGSAAYVALERVTGSLEGRRGTFVLQHTGVMNRGARSLTVTIVPDSGTGALEGISGRMTIEIAGGRHFYELEYALPL